MKIIEVLKSECKSNREVVLTLSVRKWPKPSVLRVTYFRVNSSKCIDAHWWISMPTGRKITDIEHRLIMQSVLSSDLQGDCVWSID